MIREVNACTGHKHNGKGLTEIRNTNSLGTHVVDCPKYSGQLDVVKVSSWQLETRVFHPVKVMAWLIPCRENNGLFEIVHSGIQRLILGDWSTDLMALLKRTAHFIRWPCQWLSNQLISKGLLLYESSQHSRVSQETFPTVDQSDENTWPGQQKIKYQSKTKGSKILTMG